MRWPLLAADRGLSEAEVAFFQFQEQIDDMIGDGEDVTQIAATDRFDFLPPMGMSAAADRLARWL